MKKLHAYSNNISGWSKTVSGPLTTYTLSFRGIARYMVRYTRSTITAILRFGKYPLTIGYAHDGTMHKMVCPGPISFVIVYERGSYSYRNCSVNNKHLLSEWYRPDGSIKKRAIHLNIKMHLVEMYGKYNVRTRHIMRNNRVIWKEKYDKNGSIISTIV